MARAWLTFEERKSFLKWYIKFENVTEVHCQWKHEFQTQPPTCLTITRLCVKFDTHGTICGVHRGRYGSLIHLVPFVVCIGEDTEDLLPPQVLLLQLWFWRVLQHRHGSLLHNVHLRQGLAVQVYDEF